jgi:hypothetical protein
MSDLITNLNLNSVQIGIGNQRVFTPGSDCHHITGSYNLLHAIDNRSSFTRQQLSTPRHGAHGRDIHPLACLQKTFTVMEVGCISITV